MKPDESPAATEWRTLLDADGSASAARRIAAILHDPRSLSLRAELLEWLCGFAESTAYDPNADDECRAVLPEVYTAVLPFIDNDDLAVREAALGVVSVLPDLADARLFQRVLASSGDRRERASAVFGLGEAGADTTSLLTDADPAIRVCAALTPGCADDSEATRLILEALRDPAAADAWFPEPLPQFDGWFRFTLVAAAIERAETFEDLLPAALAVVAVGSCYTVDSDWGPLLAKAFPTPYDGTLTSAQRSFLSAVAENDRNWGTVANPLIWLRKAGLPETRDELRELVRSGT
ncbi:HEAT repeat domain-containing protein [Kibdelosporangium persicum]|uniref:HEAT repeat domain-containing protein n=1 Tax=Kibdelosporangium persicum TaxID=2698649 RepID=UPI0015655A0D|nr:hypothetical protein [Kibdelosporangium persicum]